MEKLHIYGKITYLWKNYISMEKLHIYGKIIYLWKNYISMEKLHIYGKITYLWKNYISMEKFSSNSLVKVIQKKIYCRLPEFINFTSIKIRVSKKGLDMPKE